jgi:hypothetical protein
LGACRLQTEGFVPIAGTGRTAGITSAVLLFRLLSSPTASASDPTAVPEARPQPPALVALATTVCATPDVVRLRILASGDVNPGSVEIRFLGRQAIVRARGADGRVIRSEPFLLPARIVEAGSSADYDAEGALVMTFRRPATVQDARRTSDPELVRCPRLDALAERK